MVRRVAPPPAARALATLHRVDYEDGFRTEIGGAGQRTAEDWARALLEDAPAGLRKTCQAVWTALGLKLGPAGSGRHVLGWPLRRSSTDHVLLAADSPLGLSAEVLIKRTQRTLLFATFLQQKNPVARAVWAGIAPGHRQVVRCLLGQVKPP